jgi:tetratricopeptide (TPR) repeat protein
LGALATKGGNFDEAESHLQEGLTLAGDIGHREHTIHLLINLGALYVEKGALDDARPTLEKALRLAEKINHKRYISITQKQLDDLSRRV